MTTRRKTGASKPAASSGVIQLRERKWKPDDDEIATIIAAEWAGKVAFFHGTWWVYEAGVWTPRVEQQVNQSIREQLRPFRGDGINVTFRLVRSVARLLEGDKIVADRDISAAWKQAEAYINLRNGLFNLETFQLEPHRPDLHLTTQLDFDYQPDADAPTFRRFLKTSLVSEDGEHDAESAAMLFEALGYSLTAKTDLKASFWLIGKPNSGKSTLIALIRALAGALHGTVDLNRIGGNQFILSAIVGKRVVTFTEADSNAVLPDALYKAMVGGTDEIWADVKNKPAIAFIPQAKFWWAMNEVPRVMDRSGATINRLFPILFNRSIPKGEQIAGLNQRLADERAGIFNIAMNAYRNLMRRGKFIMPEQSQRWTEGYRLENDTEQTFILERMIVEPAARISSSELYTAYKWWCDENGFRTKNSNQIVKDWERLGFTRHRSDGRTIWTGLRAKNDSAR